MNFPISHIFMTQVLEELQLSVRALRQDRSAERFHDLLDSHGLTGELILCGAIREQALEVRAYHLTRMHNTRQAQRLPFLQVADPCTYSSVKIARSERFVRKQGLMYLLVISKVVPKIWARTNSAMMTWWPE